MAEQVSGRVRLPKGFDSQAESVIESTLVIQQGALEFPDGTFFTSSIDTTAFVTTSSFNAFTATYNSGSFSGSFRGDGSQLTGIVATVNTSSLVTTSSFNAFTASINSFTASYSTGSFTGSLTGSLSGTASWARNALTASLAPNYVLTSITSSMTVASSSYATIAEDSYLLDGLDSTAFAQLAAQNLYTETNTFRNVTYYQADSYNAAHIAIVPTLGTNGDTVEVFNIYSIVSYNEIDETRNCTAIFTYNIEDITTGKTVRGGQVLMVWSPTHSTYSTLVDTNAAVYGGDITFNIIDDYTLSSEYVKLTMTNNSGGNVYVRGLLTIT